VEQIVEPAPRDPQNFGGTRAVIARSL
jgi:hypothetical protein